MKKKIILLSFIASLCLFTTDCFAQQKGNASFYAHRFQGRKMSNGVPYHSDSLTCAHRTLPFGTLLEVFNPMNNKKVIVKVTDRGPRYRNRLIDLSYAAAKELGIINQGIAQVEIKEWEFNPYYLPLPIPFNAYGLFVNVKSATEILQDVQIDIRTVLK
jgi:rare lipoprotein A